MARAVKAQAPRAALAVAPDQPDPDRPLITVGESVDTQAEVDALLTWAKTHPPALGSGQMAHRKRALQPIESLYRQP